MFQLTIAYRTMMLRAAAIFQRAGSCTVHNAIVAASWLPRQQAYTTDCCGRISTDGIVSSPFPDAYIPETNLCDFVFNDLKKSGDEVVLVDAVSGKEVTFDHLRASTAKVSSGLVRMGLSRGDVLAIVSPNNLEYGPLFLAVAAAGGVVSTINPTYTAEEIGFQLKNSGSKFVVTIPPLLPVVKEAAAEAGVENIVVMDDSDQKDRGLISYRTLLHDSGSLFKIETIGSRNDVVALPYSSGTTGLPKGVMLTHHNIVSNICQFKHPELQGFPDGSAVLALLPFFHIYGMVVLLLSGIHRANRLIVLPKFEPTSFLSAIQNHSVYHSYLVPPLALFLAKHPEVAKYDLSSMQTISIGAAPLGGDLAREVKQRIGVEMIRQGYGLTETSPVTHYLPCSIHDSKFASVGPPIPNQLAKIVSIDDGQTLRANQEGEVMVKGPNIMKGYLNNPEATSSTINSDGWLHTGDIGYYDTDGHFFITDRLKELIKVKGFQVAPAELESLLQVHPKIADAAVVGVLNEQMGEAPKAFVVRRDASLSAEEVAGYIRERVSEHKRLEGGVEFIEQVPKSLSGKILRRILRNGGQ